MISLVPIDIDGLSYDELRELNRRVVERLKMLRDMQAHVDMMRYNLGAQVSFEGHHGEREFGTLVKFNRKTVTVITESGRRWNVPPEYLSPVHTAESTENSDSLPKKNPAKNKKGK